MGSLSNKNILITGGSSGIGYALAELFVRSNANVWIIASTPDRTQQAKYKLAENKQSSEQIVDSISLDVSDFTQVSDQIGSITKNKYPPDILINSAGVAHPGKFEELDIDIFKWMMDVNYFGTINTTKVVVPSMIKRRKGHIVNISSMAGFLGVYGYTAYSASKYAVRGFSDSLRSEMKPYGIGVSIVFPPDTDTPQLTYEEKYKPQVTKDLTSSAGKMSAEGVAKSIFRGIKAKKYVITPGFEAFMYLRLTNLFGNLVYPIMDLMIAQSIRNTNPKEG